MNLLVKNKTQQLVVLELVGGDLLSLPPRGQKGCERVITAEQKSQDVLIKEERGIIHVAETD
jgi:hypothetical protein